MPVIKTVTCPRDPKWLKAMLDFLPEGLRGRLEPYSACFDTPPSSVSLKPSAGRPARRSGDGQGAIRPRLVSR